MGTPAASPSDSGSEETGLESRSPFATDTLAASNLPESSESSFTAEVGMKASLFRVRSLQIEDLAAALNTSPHAHLSGTCILYTI